MAELEQDMRILSWLWESEYFRARACEDSNANECKMSLSNPRTGEHIRKDVGYYHFKVSETTRVPRGLGLFLTIWHMQLIDICALRRILAPCGRRVGRCPLPQDLGICSLPHDTGDVRSYYPAISSGGTQEGDRVAQNRIRGRAKAGASYSEFARHEYAVEAFRDEH